MLGHILALAALWMAVAGCNIWSGYGPEDGLSELSISVSVSNTPAMPTKAVTINPNDYIGALIPPASIVKPDIRLNEDPYRRSPLHPSPLTS